MNVIKPKMYDRFTCSGGDCPFTCCREWKIRVEDETFKKWKKTPVPETAEFRSDKKLSNFTIRKDGDRVICLDQQKLCPFLRKDKLCSIVTDFGDDMLSKTCQIFPREKHFFEDHLEYTLMPSCPVVIDAMYEDENAMELCGVLPENDLWMIRSRFLELMKNKAYSPEKALLIIFYMALDLMEKPLSAWDAKAEEELSLAVSQMETEPQDMIFEGLELFLDLSENYRKEGLYESILEPLAKEAEELLEEGENGEELWSFTFEESWKSFAPLLRTFLLEELWADTLLPEGTLTDMIVKLQWISMEYAAIRAAAFLTWKKAGELSYEALREVMVTICRMTGYEEEDIIEYLENSFEALIWEWGYEALIIGK